ncbi:MAG: phosphoglucosamine mutase [Halanaeroarchaeum sp.]
MDVFGSSGTRGVANERLSPAFVLDIALAAGSTWDGDRVALARDTRTSGRMLANAAASGLQSVGMEVDRLGVVPTPALQSYCEAEGVPGVMITASHNPPEYNGVKLVGADGIELPVEALERVERRFEEKAFESATWDGVGSDVDVDGAGRRYIEELLSAVDREAIAAADLTVALDPGNGAGSITSPTFLRELGCEVVTVNAHADGHFPGRDPEPVEENLADLGRLVRAADADVGVAHDGDADRAIFFDETGSYVEGDAALAALAEAELAAGDTTVSAVNVSQRLVDVVDRVGATLELTPIGSTKIMTRIRALRESGESVPVAGEGNGGVIFPPFRLNRDGAYTAARFLELIADAPASEVIEPYDGYANVRVNIAYDSDEERDRLVEAAAAYADDADDADVTTIDGYRLDYGDAWVLVRPSGTEPVVRMYGEARSRSRASELVEDVSSQLRDAIGSSIEE